MIQVNITGYLGPIKKEFGTSSECLKYLKKLNADKLQAIYEACGYSGKFTPGKYLVNANSQYGTNCIIDRYSGIKKIKEKNLYMEMGAKARDFKLCIEIKEV